MSATHMTTNTVSGPKSMVLPRIKTNGLTLRRSLDDELWLKLDRKLAERDAARSAAHAGASPKGLLVRIAQGMGLRCD